MPRPLWDASALAKRYALETGSETVEGIFNSLRPADMVTTFLSYAETFSLLLRKHNRGDVSATVFSAAVRSLQAETVASDDFNLLAITDRDIVTGVGYMRKYNVNSSDAAILAAFLRYADGQTPGSPTCFLVAADQRLLRAASAEGLATLNPESVAPADVPALLSNL